ncbi:DUF3309 family protein [Salinihabitans flavidus]|uniref:DUF3309 family protein n=1 Tax=Salinihabitans flavidus TaxID=569882 RepID=UPI001FE03DE2|nr:DUF3309 family protein [Salinihabitans flavidus]
MLSLRGGATRFPNSRQGRFPAWNHSRRASSNAAWRASPLGHSQSWGYWPSGTLGVILLILIVTGRL